jgi:hypothetical protein
MRLILSSVSVESVSEFDADCTTQIQQVVLLKPSLTPTTIARRQTGQECPNPCGDFGKGQQRLG